MKKRFLSFVLCLCIVATLLPMSALAGSVINWPHGVPESARIASTVAELRTMLSDEGDGIVCITGDLVITSSDSLPIEVTRARSLYLAGSLTIQQAATVFKVQQGVDFDLRKGGSGGDITLCAGATLIDADASKVSIYSGVNVKDSVASGGDGQTTFLFAQNDAVVHSAATVSTSNTAAYYILHSKLSLYGDITAACKAESRSGQTAAVLAKDSTVELVEGTLTSSGTRTVLLSGSTGNLGFFDVTGDLNKAITTDNQLSVTNSRSGGVTVLSDESSQLNIMGNAYIAAEKGQAVACANLRLAPCATLFDNVSIRWYSPTVSAGGIAIQCNDSLYLSSGTVTSASDTAVIAASGTITGGTYATTGGSNAVLRASVPAGKSLTVSGGSFTSKGGAAVIVTTPNGAGSAGTVNLKGGSFTTNKSGDTNVAVINSSVGRLNISGGTYTGGSCNCSLYNLSCGEVSISSGDLAKGVYGACTSGKLSVTGGNIPIIQDLSNVTAGDFVTRA